MNRAIGPHRPLLTIYSRIPRYPVGEGGKSMASRASHYRTVAAASLERRAEPRYPVHISRATARSRGREATATLCDISTYGCRLQASVKHPPGERLLLKLNGSAPLAATVIWSEGGRMGCRFDESLPREIMRELIA